MSKLNVIIVDEDEQYVKSVTSYLSENHHQKIHVTSFTNLEYFEAFISETHKIDILLVALALYEESLLNKYIDKVIILENGRVKEKYHKCNEVNKYQTGDALISSIMNIFAEKDENIFYGSTKEKNTKVISVYSPIGGVGKTCISIATSSACAHRGLEVFYLNLESISSTPIFFNCDKTENLSHLIYYLRQKNKNLSTKIEGVRCSASVSRHIHYFCPPDSAQEMEDIKVVELKHLISELKALGQYDFVIIDMSSEFSHKNISIIENSDNLFLVLTPNKVEKFRIQSLLREFKILCQKQKVDILEKVTVVINKHEADQSMYSEETNIFNKQKTFYLPKTSQLIGFESDERSINMNSPFGQAVTQLLSSMITEGKYSG